MRPMTGDRYDVQVRRDVCIAIATHPETIPMHTFSVDESNEDSFKVIIPHHCKIKCARCRVVIPLYAGLVSRWNRDEDPLHDGLHCYQCHIDVESLYVPTLPHVCGVRFEWNRVGSTLELKYDDIRNYEVLRSVLREWKGARAVAKRCSALQLKVLNLDRRDLPVNKDVLPSLSDDVLEIIGAMTLNRRVGL